MDNDATAIRKITKRLVPFLILCYFAAYLDRVNISFAALTMNQDLGLSLKMYGLGAGLFFTTYALFEVPSNLALARYGARRWIARIMVTWGIISASMAFIPQISVATGASPEHTFYALRMLLGAAEAGFFPGIIFYQTLWFPTASRGRITGYFMMALPLAGLIGSPASSLLLSLDGWHGLTGWQWMFIFEGVSPALLSIVVLLYLPDVPSRASWLTRAEVLSLNKRLQAEAYIRLRQHSPTILQAMLSPKILLLGFVLFGMVASRDAITFFLPQIVKGFGLTNTETGFVAAIPFLAGAIAMPLWGWHSDGRRQRKGHVAMALWLAAAGLGASAVLDNPVLKLAAISVSAFGSFAALPTFWTLPTSYLTGAAAAAAIAAIDSLGQLGGFYGPSLIGWMANMSSTVDLGVVTVACITMMSSFVVLVLWHDEVDVSGAQQVAEPAE